MALYYTDKEGIEGEKDIMRQAVDEAIGGIPEGEKGEKGEKLKEAIGTAVDMLAVMTEKLGEDPTDEQIAQHMLEAYAKVKGLSQEDLNEEIRTERASILAKLEKLENDDPRRPALEFALASFPDPDAPTSADSLQKGD